MASPAIVARPTDVVVAAAMFAPPLGEEEGEEVSAAVTVVTATTCICAIDTSMVLGILNVTGLAKDASSWLMALWIGLLHMILSGTVIITLS
eukprot:SAG11_NODE_560_length_8528_cov_4.697710_8_plen_92_part_00